MQADEWEEIKRIFESALKLSEAEQFKFLKAACQHRPGLQGTVAALIKAHQEASSGFLEKGASAPVLPVFEPGQLIAGRFRIIRFIDRGGIGEIYEAFDERLNVRLALKTLRKEFASDRDSLERFRREIRVTRDIGHPNLCRVHELVEHRLPPEEGEEEERIIPCLTMQLMSGENLQHYIKRSGALSPQAALPLLRQIAGAVQVLHENGIIHRDLKPSNVMITVSPDGSPRPIVMDFGLAKPNGEADLFESRDDFQIGAPYYLAPELLQRAKPSVATDLYALALIIDDMVTGGGAFAGETVGAILYQKMHDDPIDPAVRKPGLPAEWYRVIRQGLHRDPSKRLRTAVEMVEELSPASSISHTRPLPITMRFRGLRSWIFGVNRSRERRVRLRKLLVGIAVVALAAGSTLRLVAVKPTRPSFVVFDFKNLTGDPKNDPFALGITLELERRLFLVPGASLKPYHGAVPDEMPKIASELSIEGYLQAYGAEKRLYVEVIENATGKAVWVKSYETTSANLLKTQSEVAGDMAYAIRTSLVLPNSGSLQHRPALVRWLVDSLLPETPTQSNDAMWAYVNGHKLWQERTLSSELAAVDQYQRALLFDPKFALAEAELAGVYLSLLQRSSIPRAPILRAAREHAERAVQIGPELAEAYTPLAAVQQAEWDWAGAEKSYRKAINLNPNFALAHRWFAGLLVQFGKFDEGLREARTALELDPYDSSAKFCVGTYLHYAGKVPEEIEFLKEALEEHDSGFGHMNLAYAFTQLGASSSGSEREAALDQALAQTEILDRDESKDLSPGEVGDAAPLYALIYGFRGEEAKARIYLNKMLAFKGKESFQPIDVAHAYVAIGENEEALHVLKQAVDAKDPGMLYLKVDPTFDSLHNTSGFRALVSQTGL